MKPLKYIAPVLLILAGIAFYNLNKQSSNSLLPYFDKNLQATDPVVKLLGLTGIRIQNDSLVPDKTWPEARLTLKSRSLEEITAAIQGKLSPDMTWKRANNKERWEATLPFSLSQDQIAKIKEIVFNELGTSQEIKLINTTYKGVLFLGSTISSVRKRLAYLNKLIDSKAYTLKPIYVLSGERTLSKAIGETLELLLDPNNGEISFKPDWKKPIALPDNETNMIKVVFDQSKHPSIKDEDVIFVHTLKKNGQIRATTETTIYKWIEECRPAAGTYLAISNQPYVFYQALSIRKSLLKAGRKDIHVEVVGPAITSKIMTEKEQEAIMLLDNVASIFYEMVEIKKLTN